MEPNRKPHMEHVSWSGVFALTHQLYCLILYDEALPYSYLYIVENWLNLYICVLVWDTSELLLPLLCFVEFEFDRLNYIFVLFSDYFLHIYKDVVDWFKWHITSQIEILHETWANWRHLHMYSEPTLALSLQYIENANIERSSSMSRCWGSWHTA